ncbi:MAG: hypothetical protein AAF747_05345, partial [Planctomycetota bacterium]
PTFDVPSIPAFDDDGDGIIDGFSLDGLFDFGDISLGLDLAGGGGGFADFSGLALDIADFAFRPEAGLPTVGSLDFGALAGEFLPEFAGSAAAGLADIASIDPATGTLTLDWTLPAELRKDLTLGGIVPFEIERVGGSASIGGEISAEFTGRLASSRLTDTIGQAISDVDIATTLELWDGSQWVAATTLPLTFGVTFNSSGYRLTETPAIRAGFSGLTLPLGGSLGSLEAEGFLAFGGTDDTGLPTALPTAAGTPYAGNEVAGILTAASDGPAGTLNGQAQLQGSIDINGPIIAVALSLQADLAGDLAINGFEASGTAVAIGEWSLTADLASGSVQTSGLPTLTSFNASQINLVVPDVLRLEIDSIDYAAMPVPGDPIASATDITVTALGALESAGVTAQLASIALYDDSSDDIIDGFEIGTLTASMATEDVWEFGPAADPLLRVDDLVVTYSGYVYRPASESGVTLGTITLELQQVQLFPNGTQPFTANIAEIDGQIDVATGDLLLEIGTIAAGFGPGAFFQIELTDTVFRLDSDDNTDILTVAEAELRLDDGQSAFAAVTFTAADFRFNIVNDQPRFGIGEIELDSQAGVLASLGLSGFVPFDVKNLLLDFAQQPDGYTDFNQFTLTASGEFDLTLLDQITPFTPTLSIGAEPADDGGTPNTFDFTLGFNVAERRVEPIELADIRVGFEDFTVGEFVFQGELLFAGYSGGVLQPTVTGVLQVDSDAANNQVQSSSGTGIDFLGATIDLAGAISRTGNVTTATIDVAAQFDFDLRLGDFLEVSDLGFDFGLDIAAPDNFLDDPINLVSITPRLESLTVGSISASVGDFIQLSAVPGTGGSPGLVIDFNPDPGQPLATFNFSIASPAIGLSGTIDNLKLLDGGIPDFEAIDAIAVDLISRTDGSPSLLDSLFSEFLPLGVTGIKFKFNEGFFEYADGGSGFSGITGIADPAALNLFVSGRAGTPSWFPDDFSFDIGSDFNDLEIDLTKLIQGQFPIVSLSGLSFELGVDLGPIQVGGSIAVGVVDADPGPGDAPVYYLGIEGGLVVGDYGAEGAIALTTAGPVGVTLSVPLAIVLGQSGFIISGVAGTVQFGTTVLPDPADINTPSDLGQSPNPFEISLADPTAIRGVVQSLWDDNSQSVLPTWTQPITLAIQGELTHVAVAGTISGTATLAANISLPIDGNQATDGLVLLGFGDIRMLGVPLADATLLFDLRDPINPTFGTLFQAPADTNPLGMLFPAQADFGVLLQTDGLAIATATALNAFFSNLASGAVAQGQLFFETVAASMLDDIQADPSASALATLLASSLPVGTDWIDLTDAQFIELLRDQLNIDAVLNALASNGGQDVNEIAGSLQTQLNDAITLANAVVADLFNAIPRAIAKGINTGLDVASNLVALGIRTPAQAGEPLDPLGLLTSLDPASLGVDRIIPIEYISEATALITQTLSAAVRESITETAAFIVSDAFNPRLLIEGSIQPTVFGLPVGDPLAGVQLGISKNGISYGLTANIIDSVALLGTTAFGAVGNLLSQLVAAGVSDQTTIAYELPFDAAAVITALTQGGIPEGGYNPFDPAWGQLTSIDLTVGGFTTSMSLVQFGSNSTLLENNVHIDTDLNDPVQLGKIPVSSQELLDRMLANGGLLLSTGVYQPKLLVDPAVVIQAIIDRAEQTGQTFEDTDGELDFLFTLFSEGPAFLEAVQDSLLEVVEFSRAQAYLPISYSTLMPQTLQDALAGDPATFNDLFRQTYINPDGSVNFAAVEAALQTVASDIQTGAQRFAANTYIEGLLNAKLFGIELGNGRIFGGVVPDPDNPGQDLDLGLTALRVTGSIPWLAGLQVDATLDVQDFTLPAPPSMGDDPLAALRAAFGDTVPLPRAEILATLDSAGGNASQLAQALAALGLDPSFFNIAAGVQTAASLRAFTPGYDLASNDPLRRVGGIELEATLDIAGIVSDAEFRFRITPPTGGGFVPFEASAEVGTLSLGGVIISDAVVIIVSDANGIRLEIEGTAEALGATFTVDGQLQVNTDITGSLEMSLDTGDPTMALGGLTGGAAASFSIVRVAGGATTIAFAGSLASIPGVGGSLAFTGNIQPDGSFRFTTGTTDVSLGGFTIHQAALAVLGNTPGDVSIEFAGAATVDAIGASFSISGEIDTDGNGELQLTLASGTPSLGGLSATGTFSLIVTDATSAEIGFNGTVSGVAGSGAVAFTGTIDSDGEFDLEASATNFDFGGFAISNALLAYQSRTITFPVQTTLFEFTVSGDADITVLGASFSASGKFDSNGNGNLALTLSAGSQTPEIGGFATSGTFRLELRDDAPPAINFEGQIS